MKKIFFFFIIICAVQFIYIFQFRSNFNYEIIKNPFDVDSGISYSVSPEIIESRTILKNQKVLDFNLSDIIKKDDYLYQRAIEFNYPIKVNNSSAFVLFLKKEVVPDSCKIIESGEYLTFARC